VAVIMDGKLVHGALQGDAGSSAIAD
jgi:hypothetical protein